MLEAGHEAFWQGENELPLCGKWDGWGGHPELPLQSVERKGQLCRAIRFSLLTVEGAWTSLPALAVLKLRELNPTLADAAQHIFFM